MKTQGVSAIFQPETISHGRNKYWHGLNRRKVSHSLNRVWTTFAFTPAPKTARRLPRDRPPSERHQIAWFRSLICTGARRNPAACGPNQGTPKRLFAPLMRAGGSERCNTTDKSHSSDLSISGRQLQTVQRQGVCFFFFFFITLEPSVE